MTRGRAAAAMGGVRVEGIEKRGSRVYLMLRGGYIHI